MNFHWKSVPDGNVTWMRANSELTYSYGVSHNDDISSRNGGNLAWWRLFAAFSSSQQHPSEFYLGSRRFPWTDTFYQCRFPLLPRTDKPAATREHNVNLLYRQYRYIGTQRLLALDRFTNRYFHATQYNTITDQWPLSTNERCGSNPYHFHSTFLYLLPMPENFLKNLFNQHAVQRTTARTPIPAAKWHSTEGRGKWIKGKYRKRISVGAG